MKVDMICQRAVITIHKSASVLEAARRMREHHVGDLVVVETKEGSRVPVGILTDRDLVVQVLAMEVAEIENLQVGDLLTDDLITITADAAPHLAMTRMRAEGVRRLPVVDTSGALVGILSADDLVDLLAEELGILSELMHYQPYRESLMRGEPAGRS